MKHLTKEQRYVISALKKQGLTQKLIAKELGVSPSTISRELNRNTSKTGVYQPSRAHEYACERKERFAHKRFFTKSIESLVVKYLTQEQWSPAEIVGYCKNNGIDMVSVERIYQFIRIDKQKGGDLYTHLRHRLKHRHRPIGIGSKIKIPNRVSIEARPDRINNREEFGHWEADLICGANNSAYILTLTERVSKMTLLSPLLNGKSAQEVTDAIISELISYKDFVSSITMDNGLEFAMHETVAKKLNSQTYFTHPYSSWEKGQVEYMNKLARQYYPKKNEINEDNLKNIKEVQKKLNRRPRKGLGFKTPIDNFYNFINQ